MTVFLMVLAYLIFAAYFGAQEAGWAFLGSLHNMPLVLDFTWHN